MREDFLHHIWKFQLYNQKKLQTTKGKFLQINKIGFKNTNAGPDFFNAKIKIEATDWAGNIEIHIKSSDWLKHQHQNDKSYDNVILHVVFNHDIEINYTNGNEIPVLELKGLIDKKKYSTYLKIINSQTKIPCENLLKDVNRFTISAWLERLIIERLEDKSNAILELHNYFNGDWNEVLYVWLARSFGLKINTDTFELLAKSLPYKILSKHADNQFQLEALLYGQAGMLESNFNDHYPNQLQKEYLFLKAKYKLESIHFSQWKFMRLRPVAFPTLRISQFAKALFLIRELMFKNNDLLDFVKVKKMLLLSASSYWDTHYMFDKKSDFRLKNTGKSFVDLIIINAIVPFVFTYGKQIQKQNISESALQLLESLSKEKNTVISFWEEAGIKTKNAKHSQALLQLKNNYCDSKKCLNCAIGIAVLG